MPEKLGSWLLLKLESITIRILLLAIWMWLCLNSLDLFLGVREVVAASDVQRQKQLKFMCYVWLSEMTICTRLPYWPDPVRSSKAHGVMQHSKHLWKEATT